jgi:hypothetical protein
MFTKRLCLLHSEVINVIRWYNLMHYATIHYTLVHKLLPC